MEIHIAQVKRKEWKLWFRIQIPPGMRSNKGFLDPFQRKHIRKTVTITIIYRNREKERVKVRGREIERNDADDDSKRELRIEDGT